MKVKASLCFLVFLLLVTIYVIIEASRYRFLEAKLLLLVVSGIVLVLGAVQLVREIRPRNGAEKQPAKEETRESAASGSEAQRTASALGWTAGLFLGTYLLGLTIAGGLFTLTYLKVRRKSWVKAILIAVVTIGVINVISIYGLKVDLYPGLLFEYTERIWG